MKVGIILAPYKLTVFNPFSINVPLMDQPGIWLSLDILSKDADR